MNPNNSPATESSPSKADNIIDTDDSTPSLTRQKLAERLQNLDASFSKKEMRSFVDSILDIMGESLLTERPVKISGFGKLKVKNKAARSGRNPKTTEKIIISRRKVVTFQPSKKLLDSINASKP